MTCTNCALGIEKYLEKEGLENPIADFSAAEVHFDLVDSTKLPRLVKGINRLGFKVVEQPELAEEGGCSRLEWYLLFASIFTFPLLLHMFVSWPVLHNPFVQLGLCLPVFLLGLWHFGRSGWHSLRSGVANMDVLVALGATAAFGYSLYGTITASGPDFLFYETAAAIITLVLLGNVMEHRAVRRTTTALRELDQLQAEQATLIDKDTQAEQIVAANMIQLGHQLRVRQGETIPADGRLLQGHGLVDRSMLTGESIAESVEEGNELTGGTLLVEGNLVMEVTAVGKQTTLARIIELVRRAQRDKPAIQQLADKISAIFVPAVLGVSLLTFLLSWWVFDIGLGPSLIHSIAVLVIACPCAMGLATPTAVIVGLGRATRNGMLVKGGRTLEAFEKVQHIVFDKTGTLTTGQFKIGHIEARGVPIAEVKPLLMALEQASVHPLARSIVAQLEGTVPAALSDIREMKGIGMQGQDAEGQRYQLGSWRLAQHIDISRDHSLYLMRGEELIAWVDMEDSLREGTKETVEFLQRKGIRVSLLSGDREKAVAQVATALGISEYYGAQLPDEKLARIEAWSAEGLTAMVGDGINDAPALARAGIGISLGNASDIARQSAEIILIDERLDRIPHLFGIAKHTVKTIRQNLFWAFFYNVLAIPLAAFGFLRPILGTATMALSDVVVIGNSLRLRQKNIST